MGADWNEEVVIYKAKKKGIIDQRPVGNTKKQRRGWKVKYDKTEKKRWFGFDYVWHRGATLEACIAWVEKEDRIWVGTKRKANYIIISPTGEIYERDESGQYRQSGENIHQNQGRKGGTEKEV